jgi:hypothetical protein
MKNLFNNMDSLEIVRILEMHKKQGYSTINEQKNEFSLNMTQFNRSDNKPLSTKFRNAQNIAKDKGQLAFKYNGRIYSTNTGLEFPNPFKNPKNLENFQKYVLEIIKDSSIGRADSLWGLKTANAALKYGKKYYEYISKQKSETKNKTKSKDRCIAISTQECSKIDSTKQTPIGSGSETRCSAYMIKCLSQYDDELYGGDAWDVFWKVIPRGTAKYNVYTDGSVNWDYIYEQLNKNKIGRSICNEYAKQDDADKKVKSKLPSIISDSMPKSSKININSLRLGDIVGLYHSGSANKGMAFCRRALKKNLDDNGNINEEPFTFNSHVGFVGAIKDGIPIIIHNIHGTHTATPANTMISKTSQDMIVWVVSDNEVAAAIERENNKI